MAPILGYWDIRGLANPIRMLLEYTGTKFEEKEYVAGPAPDYDRSCWTNVKFTLGLDLPNLPYFIDGDLNITQSNAIIRHIGRINNMDGKTEAEKVRVDIMENQLMDFRNGWVRLCYGDFDGGKADYIKKLPDNMKQFSEYLGKRKWLAGDHLAEPIRLLLEYTGTQFEDKVFVFGPKPQYDRSCWTDVKFTLGLDFPNLPYYLDGDVKISQSNAIIRHIARINNLDGKTDAEKVRVDIMENQLMDLRNGWVQVCYGDILNSINLWEGGIDDYINKLPDTIKQYAEFLGDNKWLAGDSLTFPDFILFELLDQHQHLVPDLLKNHSNLGTFMENFRQLEQIKAYWSSARYKKRTLNGPMAQFGGSLKL